MGELRAAVCARASSNQLSVAEQLAVALRGQVVQDELRVPSRTHGHQALLLSEFQAAGIEVVGIDRLRGPSRPGSGPSHA
jgi:hypothetical protein